MALTVASASLACAVMPTAAPMAALSATLLAAASASVTALTSNSSTSATAIENTWVLKLPSAEVARTVMLWLEALSRSRPPATVTTPVPEAMAKRPPALSSSE